MNKIDTILFDLGGVLVDCSVGICEASFRQLGYPHAGHIIDIFRTGGVSWRLESGQIAPEQFYAEIISAIGHPVDTEQIDRALCSFLVDLPESKLDLLLDLRRRGYRVMMLSNTNSIMFDYIRDRFFRRQGLTTEHYFDRIFLSYQMKCMKPDPEIFHKVIREAGLTAKSTLFIDDSEANVVSAASLGFRCYQAHPGEDLKALFAAEEDS